MSSATPNAPLLGAGRYRSYEGFAPKPRNPNVILRCALVLLASVSLVLQLYGSFRPFLYHSAIGVATQSTGTRPLDMSDALRQDSNDARAIVSSDDSDILRQVTIGAKIHVCDPVQIKETLALLSSIRWNYPHVRVLLANDGPVSVAGVSAIKNDPYADGLFLPTDSGTSYGRNAMVNRTTTKYFVSLDDEHLFSPKTDLAPAVKRLEYHGFDIVGMRVVN